MKWKHPPIIKIYEALGAVVDNRVEVSGNSAKVYSSTRNKFYDVLYEPKKRAIMTNDNGSYWKGYLGYPAIAYLLKVGVFEFKPALANLLKDIKWKDINQKFNNNFEQTMNYIEKGLKPDQKEELVAYVQELNKEIEQLDLSPLGSKVIPPSGY